MLYILFFLLGISVLWLISRLKKKRDQAQGESDKQRMFDKEIKLLWVILGVFNITYLIRAVWDSVTNEFYVDYGTMVGVMMLAILWDFVPVMILLVFHYRNYKDQAKQSVESLSHDEDTTTNTTSFINQNQKLPSE